VYEVEPASFNNAKASTSAIRALLAEGKQEEAERLMGHTFHP